MEYFFFLVGGEYRAVEVQSVKLRNTGNTSINITVPFDIITGTKTVDQEVFHKEIILKPKERLAYKVTEPGNLGSPEVTIIGDMYNENYVTWGMSGQDYTRYETYNFKNYKAIGLPEGAEKYYYITNVSDHNLKVVYPIGYMELRKVPVFEDINIIASSALSNRFSSYLSVSGDNESLVSDPIDTATGAFTSVIDTLNIKGVVDLALSLKYYSSMVENEGIFGKGWETDYSATISIDSEIAKIRWTQNRFSDYIIEDYTNKIYRGADESTKHDKLKVEGKQSTLTKKDGTKWIFYDSMLIEIVDRTGKSITFERSRYGGLLGIIDTVTQNKILFDIPYWTNLVHGVRDNLGNTVTFTYNNNRMIDTVTDQNGNVTKYTYDDNGRILTSEDTEGNILFINTYDDKGRVIEQENNGKTIFKYIHDEEKEYQITEVTDRNGNKKTLYHDLNFKLIKVVDELLGITEKTYNTEGLLSQETDANGNKTSYEYDEKGNLVKTIDAKNNETLFDYDVNDNVTKITKAGNNRGTFLYENNLLITETDKFGNTKTYTYNENKQVETITKPNTGKTTYTYENGLLKTVTDSTGVTTTYEHDQTGRLTATIDQNNNRTELTYDNNGNLLTTKDAKNTIITFTYDHRNRKTSETDQKGNTTTYTYDNNNNLKTQTNALNQTTSYKYDNEDRIIKTIDPKGNITQFIRDEKGQIITVIDPLGNTITTEYDKVGNISAIKDAYNQTTQMTEYDQLNLPTKVTDTLGNSTLYEYNQWSDVTKTVNPMNQINTFNYYDLGLISGVTDALGTTTTQTYDEMFQRTSFTDANNNTTSFSYDLEGRITSVTLQNGSTVTYEYNNLGQLSKTTNARGQVFTYEYDELGRLTKTTKPEGSIITTYDANGNILTKQDEAGTLNYEYDNLNRVLGYTDVYGNRLGYTYDENSNLTQLKYPDGKIVTYGYDALNRLVSVADWNNRVTTYEYDNNSRLIKTDRPNGTYELRAYDAKGQLLTLKDYKTDGTLINEEEFSYNGVGNITYEGIADKSKNYTYDNLNRISNVYKTDGSQFNYTFDAQSNLTSVVNGDTTLNMTYGENNWLININDSIINYDLDGNSMNTILNGQDISLVYDSQNRLVSAGDTTYRYDVNNNRISIKEVDKETKLIVNPIAEYSQVLLETDELGRITKHYVYGIGLIGEETLDNTYITYHYDYRGSTVALTDELGEIQKTFEYGTYGELLTPYEGYRFLYNGRDGVQTDTNGLYYMRARYYNPDIKRFINQDILLGDISDSTSLNRYSYVNGNPINLVDPFGLFGRPSFSFQDARLIVGDVAIKPYWKTDLTGGLISGGSIGFEANDEGIAQTGTIGVGYFGLNLTLIAAGLDISHKDFDFKEYGEWGIDIGTAIKGSGALKMDMKGKSLVSLSVGIGTGLTFKGNPILNKITEYVNIINYKGPSKNTDFYNLIWGSPDTANGKSYTSKKKSNC